MVGLKLIHVSKIGYWCPNITGGGGGGDFSKQSDDLYHVPNMYYPD